MSKKDVFMTKEITNEQIYQQLQDMSETLRTFNEQNQKQHNELMEHARFTNGKVKRNTWMITLLWTSLSILTGAMVWALDLLIKHVSKLG